MYSIKENLKRFSSETKSKFEKLSQSDLYKHGRHGACLVSLIYLLIISDQALITLRQFLPNYVQFSQHELCGLSENACLSIHGVFFGLK